MEVRDRLLNLFLTQMTDRKAVEILTIQLDKIGDPKHPNNETWVIQTASYIADFFGKDSAQYSFITNFTFAVFGSSGWSDQDWRNARDSNKRKAIKFTEDCIETIRVKGLYKPPKMNFLHRVNDTWLTMIIALVLTAVGGGAFILGQYSSGLNNIELKRELKQTQDSLRSLIPVNQNIESDTTKNRLQKQGQ